MNSSQDAVLQALLRRRSIRFGFTDRAVSAEELEKIVACGSAAPSSKNAQPWRFHVVTDKALLESLADAVSAADDLDAYVPHDPRTGQPYARYTSTVIESADVLRAVPAAIWIENLGSFSAGRAALLSAGEARLAGALEGYGFELIGIGAAVENLWIAANALGLAAAFMGDVVIAETKVQELLGFRGDLVGVLVLGHSDASPRPPMDPRSFPELPRVMWHLP